MRAGWRLLVDNGALQPDDPGQAVSFLRSRPQGAYTTTRTVNGGSCLLLWERHLARVCQSIQLLSTDLTFNLDGMRKLVISSVHAGFEEALDRKSDGEELVVTVLACKSGQKLLDVYVHIASLLLAPLSPADVAVKGPSRNAPLSKSTHLSPPHI
ncbi:hypothetical protein SELMODRAFT_411930 [Selaginella moellendorffii]|uniref:Aminotransferase class IV n=1 Tax=Selaginella moellendorffii TaxID=88036 RepID=D8RJH2_SELML|nr:uncharacterized protein LOC9642074 [Selaginella moellendorffii]EFJ27719.1 hypothetical protein SELMODRAFT_411930 [Selaginella moellendorffii]|eukprot:XP_002971121.1 uncharacterized protein LOC9642074 [Selaginella moellendorffii]